MSLPCACSFANYLYIIQSYIMYDLIYTSTAVPYRRTTSGKAQYHHLCSHMWCVCCRRSGYAKAPNRGSKRTLDSPTRPPLSSATVLRRLSFISWKLFIFVFWLVLRVLLLSPFAQSGKKINSLHWTMPAHSQYVWHPNYAHSTICVLFILNHALHTILFLCTFSTLNSILYIVLYE